MSNLRIFSNLINENNKTAFFVLDNQHMVIHANNTAKKFCLLNCSLGHPFSQTIDTKKYSFVIETFNEAKSLEVESLSRQVVVDSRNYLVDYFYDKNLLNHFLNICELTPFTENEKKYEFLYQLASALAKTDNLDDIYTVAIKKILQVIDTSEISIMLYDPSKKRLKLIVRKDKDLQDIFNIESVKSFKLGQGIAGKAALNLHPITSYDVTKDKNYYRANSVDVGSLMSVPMIAGNELIGVINIHHYDNKYFTEKEVQYVTIIAGEIATAIKNNLLKENLATERNKLKKTIENTTDGVIVLNKDFGVILHNSFFKKTLGYDFSDRNAKKTMNLIFDRKLLLSRTPYYEKEVLAKDGSKVTVGLNISYVYTDENEIDEIVVVLRDISKETEMKLQQKDFISTITHELRTPLTAVLGYINMLLDGDAGDINRIQRKFLGKANNAANRLSGLIEDLLKSLRIEEDRLLMSCQNTEISHIIKESVDNLWLKAGSKNIKVTNKIDKELLVYADPNALKHILDNIIDNAIKYTKNDGKITIDHLEQSDNVLILVKDTGVGIAEKQYNKVFDRFYRIKNPLSVQAGGAGLGLFIVKKMVEKQNGKIWLESKVNKGTTFYLQLPKRR